MIIGIEILQGGSQCNSKTKVKWCNTFPSIKSIFIHTLCTCVSVSNALSAWEIACDTIDWSNDILNLWGIARGTSEAILRIATSLTTYRALNTWTIWEILARLTWCANTWVSSIASCTVCVWTWCTVCWIWYVKSKSTNLTATIAGSLWCTNISAQTISSKTLCTRVGIGRKTWCTERVTCWDTCKCLGKCVSKVADRAWCWGTS